jgi:hypothetical protein
LRPLIATIALAFLGDRLRLLAAVRSKRAAYIAPVILFNARN